MKKILPLIASIIVVLVAGVFAGAGTLAIFDDTETSYDNTLTAGTLDLKVDGEDNPCMHIEIEDIAPGWEQIYVWELKNEGSIPGVVKICFSTVTENENGINDPEEDGEAFVFTPAGCPAQTVGIADTGELGYFMRAVPSKKHIYPSVEKSPGVPCPNSWMPHGGGLHHLGEIGCFELGRNTAEATLGPGETMEFWLRLKLDTDLKSWDGCGWHDIDDNVIQSDGVEFDIVFSLEQAS
jgi:predicted ribosomally synthesized peptide with SipW-like signal peptide